MFIGIRSLCHSALQFLNCLCIISFKTDVLLKNTPYILYVYSTSIYETTVIVSSDCKAYDLSSLHEKRIQCGSLSGNGVKRLEARTMIGCIETVALSLQDVECVKRVFVIVWRWQGFTRYTFQNYITVLMTAMLRVFMV